MDKGVSSLLLGLFVLSLALVLWRLTGNFVGWAALYGPGAVYTLRGLYLVTE